LNMAYLVAPVGALLALIAAWIFYSLMMKEDPGTEKSQTIAGYVKEGAKSYLKSQYKVVGIFFFVAFLFLAFLAVLKLQSYWTPLAFLSGGFFSAFSGYLGMIIATSASNRTAAAASESLNRGLQVAFKSGAAIGFVIVGFGLLDISIWWALLNWVMEQTIQFPDGAIATSNFAIHHYTELTAIMLTFGMGASSMALFARVGGGIFTKAADVAADLVGKTEAGIPEDDPRNPATIADNVGDNVGDVAGMGADLYESYYGSMIATAALGAAAFKHLGSDVQCGAALMPLVLSGIGIFCSLVGVQTVKAKEKSTQKELMSSLTRGLIISSILTCFVSFIFCLHLLPNEFYWRIWSCIILGLAAGVFIGYATNYYTSEDYPPTKEVASQAETGYATVIIGGMATGMMSTAMPIFIICVTILGAYALSNGFSLPSMGLYGIGMAAVGMLSTLGYTLATDAYGPIADNAGGNAAMAGLGDEVRRRTDMLDSLGNTTAATGKGFAIGSAALTGLALLGGYIEEIRMVLLKHARSTADIMDQYIYPTVYKAVHLKEAEMGDFMHYYGVDMMNPLVLAGMFIGSMLVFVFCSMTMNAVGRAAHKMVEEVRRQFKEIPALLKGDPSAKADYVSCVKIATEGAQKEMIAPSLLAVISPIVMGVLLGVPGVIGMLVGALSTGFAMAIMMSNAGGAWDNAKKYVESGHFGGKGSDSHKAAVVGDTVGDPFKDTSGPSLNILIKLMSIVSVVFVGLTISFSPHMQKIISFKSTDSLNKSGFNANMEAGKVERPAQPETAKYTEHPLESSIFIKKSTDILITDTEDIMTPEEWGRLIEQAEANSKKKTGISVQSASSGTTSQQSSSQSDSSVPVLTKSMFTGFSADTGSLGNQPVESLPNPLGDIADPFGGMADPFGAAPADPFGTAGSSADESDAESATPALADPFGGLADPFGGMADPFSTPAESSDSQSKSPFDGLGDI